MKKRAAATVLWFVAMWYVGAMAAYVLGVPPVLGPVLGTAAAAIVARDPRGVIWSSASRPARDSARTGSSRVATPA